MDKRPPYAPSYPPNQRDGDDAQDDFPKQPKFQPQPQPQGRRWGANQRQRLLQEKQQTLLDDAIQAANDQAEEADLLDEEIGRPRAGSEDRKQKKKKIAVGFWIFGYGKKHSMAPGFRNPDMVSTFTMKIICIMLTRQLIRLPTMSLVLLYKPLHDWFFEGVVHPELILVTWGIYALFLLIAHSNRMTKAIRKYQLHAIMFVLAEITLGVVLCFLAFLLELGALRWYGTLDTFKDFNQNDPHDRHHWKQLKLTPPVFLIIFDLQITVNITATLLLQAFTPIHIGAHELYRIMIWLSLLTFVLSFLVIFTCSYSLLPIWDGLQSVVGTLGGLGKSWIFVYKLSRLMSGRMAPIDSMDWNDVFYAAYIIF